MNLNRYMWAYKRDFSLSILANFFKSIPVVVLPLLMGILFDLIFDLENSNFQSTGILTISILILSIIILDGLLGFISQYFSARANGAASAKIRSDVFIALQEKSHKFYDEEGTGDLVSKSIGDVASVINFYQIFTQSFGLVIGQLIFTILALFYLNIYFGIIALITLPLMYVTIRVYQRKYTPLQLETRETFGRMSNTVTEYVDNAIITRIFDSKDKAKSKVEGKMDDLRQINTRNQSMQGSLDSATGFISNLILFAFFLVGGYLVITESITIGTLISAVFIGQTMTSPIQQIGGLGNFRSQYRASEERLSTVLASEPLQINGTVIPNKQNFVPSIKFNDVSFAYTKDKDVLENINLEIEANSKIALLGASGSGKSALINLIPRFYDTREGEIYLSGENVNRFDMKSLRKMIGFVDQETFLFSRTIKENIAFGRPDATLEEVIEVAKIAQIHDFIDSLELGYDTKIGERGVNLSGGQRQRLSIARALLYDPKIVIFDDSLSAVDIKTESKIQQALDELLKNRTVIFVTQRLSTVSSTDMNIIMANGKIIERGSHEELLDLDGVYTRLFETQVDGILDLNILNEETTEVMA